MSKVGVLGGGQLARLLALAGHGLGVQVLAIDPSEQACAKAVTPTLRANFHCSDQVVEYFAGVDCLTFETENLPFAFVQDLAMHFTVFPGIDALRAMQDRLLEKQLLQKLAIDVAPFRAINDRQQLQQAAEVLGFPLLLKTRTSGYDGKGQLLINDQTQLDQLQAGDELQNCVVEQKIAFDRELSLITVRDRFGEMAHYPLVHNVHEGGILRLSRAPIIDTALSEQAHQMATTIMNELNYVGVLAIEFFQQGDTLMVNELAPRVHNSGHWTIDGAVTSQFENHLRACCGLPLGKTDAVGHSLMFNWLGMEPPLTSVLKIPYCHYHHYGKSSRPGRKVAHCTINSESENDLTHALHELRILADIA